MSPPSPHGGRRTSSTSSRRRTCASGSRQAGIVDGPVAVTPAGLERAKVVREALFALIDATIDGSRRPGARSRRERGRRRAAADAGAVRRRSRSAGRATSPPPSPRSPATASSCSAAPSGAQLLRRRALHPPVHRPLARRPAALVRDGRLRRPRQGRRLPRPPSRGPRLAVRAAPGDRDEPRHLDGRVRLPAARGARSAGPAAPAGDVARMAGRNRTCAPMPAPRRARPRSRR